MRRSWRPAAGLAALAALVMTLLLVPLPSQSRAGRAAFDLAHAPTFAGLAAATWAHGRSRLPRSRFAAAMVVWLGAGALGGLAEWLQAATGRQASWSDFLADLLGAAAGLLFIAGPTSPRGRALAWIAGAGLLAAALSGPALTVLDIARQRRELPRLASFERAAELSRRWICHNCRARRVRSHARHGEWSLEVEFGDGPWSGLALEDPPPDWRAYSELAFDVRLDAGPAVDLIVEVAEAGHARDARDRSRIRVSLVPGWQTVRVGLADVAASPPGRRLDLGRVGLLQFVTPGTGRIRRMHLDAVRLR